MIVLGSISTLVTATFLAHHQRWLAGGLTIGLGYATAILCPGTQGTRCTTNRSGIGVGIGAPLAVAGAFTMLSAAILLGVHKRHRHRESLTPRVTPGAGWTDAAVLNRADDASVRVLS